MPKRYIFTVGTSLIENFDQLANTTDINHFKNARKGTVENVLTPVTSWQEIESKKISAPKWVVSVLETTLVGRSQDGLSHTAEITTLSKLVIDPLNDDAVLLASDTADGLFCALVNAYLMAGDRGVVYEKWDWEQNKKEDLADPWKLGQRHPTNGLQRFTFPVRVLCVPGLDPTNKINFEKTGIANLVRLALFFVNQARNAKMEPQLVFTGGFKASLPILTQIASWLGPLPMIGLYETADAPIQIQVLSAPPKKELMQLALGFNQEQVSVEGRPENVRPSWNYGGKTIESFNKFDDKEIRLLFEDKPDHSGIQLSLLGKALKAYVIGELASNTGSVLWSALTND